MEMMQEQEDESHYHLTSSQCQQKLPLHHNPQTPTLNRVNYKYKKESMKERKLSFLATEEPFSQWKYKYNYVKHSLGPQERPAFVKLLNLSRVRKAMQARRLMSLNYMASTTVYCQKSKLRDKGYAWYKHLQEREALLKKKAHRPSVDKYQRFKRKVAPQPQAALHCANAQETRNPIPPMRFTEPTDYSDPLNTEAKFGAPFENVFEAAHKKNGWRRVVQTHFEKMTAVSRGTSISLGRKKKGKGQKLPDKFEIIREMRRAVSSHEIQEVLVNYRMTEFDPKKRASRTTLFKLFSIALRRAVNTHDWALASKCCESLSHEVITGMNRQSGWCLWSGGFLALLNTYTDDMPVLIKCGKLTKDLLQAYPRTIGITLATWLTQKGFFATAVQNLEEMHEKKSIYTWQRETFNNSRRNLIDFIAELFTAADQWAAYKQSKRLHEDGAILVDGAEVRRTGEFVLSLFEMLEGRGKSFDNDSTIFIEPLLELTLSLRGPSQAKETLDRICRANCQNGVLRELYLKFLLHHFPTATEEIEEQRHCLAQYDFSIPPKIKAVRQARYNRFIRRLPRVSSFTRLENPSFSW